MLASPSVVLHASLDDAQPLNLTQYLAVKQSATTRHVRHRNEILKKPQRSHQRVSPTNGHAVRVTTLNRYGVLIFCASTANATTNTNNASAIISTAWTPSLFIFPPRLPPNDTSSREA